MTDDFDPGHITDGVHPGTAGVNPSSTEPRVGPISNPHSVPSKTIRELIAENVNRYAHQDDNAVAWRTLKEISGMGDKARHLLLPLVAAEAARIRRQPVRQIEDRTLKAMKDRAPVDVVGRLTPELRRLANQPLKHGEETTWGQATVDQHRERIAWFEQHIAGCERTLALHRLVLDTLVSAGVDRLDDIRDAA